MAQQLINIGTVANDRTGDTWRNAFIKVNNNDAELFGKLSVLITAESDFPVQDGSTITLEAGQTYVITQALVVSKRFVSATGGACSFVGFGFNSSTVTYTGSGTMFSGVDASIEIRDLMLEPGSSNPFVNYSSTIALTNSVVMDKVQVGDCANFGTFNNLFVVGLDNCSSTNTTGLLFAGALGILSIDRTNFSGPSAMKGINLASSTFSLSFNIGRCSFSGPSGAFGISGLASSGNIGAGIQANVALTSFTGGLTDLENIEPRDVRWEFNSNTPTADSYNAVDAFLIGGSETITTGSAGDWQEIGVPVSGGVSWDSDIADRFTMGTDGVVTYIGEKAIEVSVSARTTVEKVGGGSNILEARIALNWTGSVSDGGLAKSRSQTQNADPTTIPLGALIAIEPNDDIRIIFSNTDGTSNIIALVASLEVMGR